MKRNRDRGDEAGQDSFLDIAANLVGILIILVIVVGARAKNDLLSAADPIETEPVALLDVASVQNSHDKLESDILTMSRKLEIESAALRARDLERQRLEAILTAAKLEVKSRTSALNANEQQQYEQQQQLAAAQRDLNELNRSISALRNRPATVKELEHLPTPMAEKVNNEEVFLRLLNGRLCYVPKDELLDAAKADMKKKLFKFKETDQISEVVGPIAGFRMRYRMRLVKDTIIKDGREYRVEQVVNEKWEMIPLSDSLGEPLAQAIQPQSQFMQFFRGKNYPPNNTTVTVWVYPDSFSEFRQLKKVLYEMGYTTASRLPPAGILMQGSPQGTATVVQ